MRVSTSRCPLLAAALVVLLAVPASAFVEDFEGPTGFVVAGLRPDGTTAPGTYFTGFTVSGVNRGGGPNSVIIFDTENPTGGDDDLGTPNESCGGPGVGVGGTCTTCGIPDASGPNCVPLGKALIIPEYITDANGDNLVDDPNDEEGGGKIMFSFDQNIVPVSITILDIDDAENVDFAMRNDTLVVVVPATDLGDNSSQTLNLQGYGQFNDLLLEFSGSCAIAELVWDTTVSVKPESWGSVKVRYRQ